MSKAKGQNRYRGGSFFLLFFIGLLLFHAAATEIFQPDHAFGAEIMNTGAEPQDRSTTPAQGPVLSTGADKGAAEQAGQTGTLVTRQTLSTVQITLEHFIQALSSRLVTLYANSGHFSHDLGEALDRLSNGHGIRGFIKMLGGLTVVFTLAAALEFVFRRLFLARISWEAPSASVHWLLRIWAVVLRAIPEFVAVIFSIAASYAVYLLVYAIHYSQICPLYLTILITVVVARSITIVSRMFFSPGEANLRLVHLEKGAATVAHRSTALFTWVVTFGIMSLSLLQGAGVHGDTLLLLKLSLGTPLILFCAFMAWYQRKPVARKIMGSRGEDVPRWFLEQFAAMWHYLALGYLFLLWGLWTGRLILVGPGFAMAFWTSLLICPIFFTLDSLLGWLLASVTTALTSDFTSREEESSEQDESGNHLILFSIRYFSRVLLAGALFVWLLYLWGVPISLSQATVAVIIDIVITLFIAFCIWKIINKSINAHLESRARAQAETGEDVDSSEWGDTPLLDRSQTLLPIMRKFIGITMIIILIMLILSSLGVNIGPLLAGAGVVGIAVGFGAQKLVSDILSGLFYLLDDAFRVGEYIEAGQISGAVEKITLRNVILRHHRGMLQIIPHSDLGAITNFMRGAIIVKFNLQFPYDTDVDLVRKVIKKVGIAMLADPEYGNNFVK